MRQSEPCHNPRSAVVIGIAAAEVGLKQCIADLVPDAGWLIEKVQSPPLVDMLRKYLPQLPARLKIGDQVLPPPKAVLKGLERGVMLRNRIVHSSVADMPTTDEIDDLLYSVLDLLWMLGTVQLRREASLTS